MTTILPTTNPHETLKAANAKKLFMDVDTFLLDESGAIKRAALTVLYAAKSFGYDLQLISENPEQAKQIIPAGVLANTFEYLRPLIKKSAPEILDAQCNSIKDKFVVCSNPTKPQIHAAYMAQVPYYMTDRAVGPKIQPA